MNKEGFQFALHEVKSDEEAEEGLRGCWWGESICAVVGWDGGDVGERVERGVEIDVRAEKVVYKRV